MFVSKSKLAS